MQLTLSLSYKFHLLLGISLMLGIFPSIASAVAAPEVELLKSFGKQEGSPGGLIQDADGNLYGTTSYGGDNGQGSLYKINTSGVHSVLFSFANINDQKSPSFLGSDGKLYGFGYINLDTEPYIKNAIFQFDPSETTPTFNTVQELDASPFVLTQDSDGKIYGVTWNSNTKKGTKFQLDTYGATPVYTVLNEFTGSFDSNLDPLAPSSFILGKDGKLYEFFIETYNTGTNELPRKAGRVRIYQIDISGKTPSSTLLFSYAQLGSDQYINSFIQGSDGNLYGTIGSSSASGFLFQLDLSGTMPVFTVLHEFSNIPGNELIQGSDGKLYGTAFNGCQANICATEVFQSDLRGTTPRYRVLHEFDWSPENINFPNALIQGFDGTLYGTTANGGSNGTGTVFQLDLSGAMPSYSLLHEFPASDTGFPIAQGSDGKYYGTTFKDGFVGFGPMFQLEFSKSTPASAIQPIFDLFLKQELTSLVKGKDGKYYGITRKGGIKGVGTLFRLDTSGAMPIYTVLHEYTPQSESGSSPYNLIQGKDGKLYGITDPNSSTVTLFQLDISGATPVYKVLQRFDTRAEDGTLKSYPFSLAEGSGNDGKLYGIAFDGVFQFDTTGITSVYRLLYKSDAAFPIDNLIQASDGKLYGTFYIDRHTGGVFQIDTSGVMPTYTVLHSLGTQGGGLPGELIQGVDGKLYETIISPSDGAESNRLFQLDISATTPNKVLYELKTDTGQPVNLYSLIQGSDSSLYASDAGGGQYGRGGIYRIHLPKANTPPVATNDSFALTIPRRNASVTVAAPGVLDNDKDAEGKALTVVGAKGATPKAVEFSEGGTVALYADGRFTYTPGKKCFYGTRNFTYQATDGQDTSNPATVTLTTKRRNHKHRGHKHGKY